MNLSSIVRMLIVLGCMAPGLVARAEDAPPRTPHPPTTEITLAVHEKHPRLVFRSAEDRGFGRTFEEVRKLYQSDTTFQAIFGKALTDGGLQEPTSGDAGRLLDCHRGRPFC